MANSTFSGPVRSQNGFQEWNGTAWVPVAGGGGMPVVVLTENNAYGTFSGGVTGGAVNLPKLEVGQSLRVVGDAASAWGNTNNFVWKVVPYVNPNSDFAYIEPNVSATKLPDPYYMQMQSFYTSSLPFPPDTLYVYRENLNNPSSFALEWITFEITYLGSLSGEGITGDIYQFGNVPFFAYYGTDGGQSAVDWYTDPLAA